MDNFQNIYFSRRGITLTALIDDELRESIVKRCLKESEENFGIVIKMGVAFCHPEDRFVKKEGLKVAKKNLDDTLLFAEHYMSSSDLKLQGYRLLPQKGSFGVYAANHSKIDWFENPIILVDLNKNSVWFLSYEKFYDIVEAYDDRMYKEKCLKEKFESDNRFTLLALSFIDWLFKKKDFVEEEVEKKVQLDDYYINGC